MQHRAAKIRKGIEIICGSEIYGVCLATKTILGSIGKKVVDLTNMTEPSSNKRRSNTKNGGESIKKSLNYLT